MLRHSPALGTLTITVVSGQYDGGLKLWSMIVVREDLIKSSGLIHPIYSGEADSCVRIPIALAATGLDALGGLRPPGCQNN